MSSETPQKQLPQKQLEESIYQPEPAFGWTPYAEQVNGRFAMIGLLFLILLEFFTQQNLITWLGLR